MPTPPEGQEPETQAEEADAQGPIDLTGDPTPSEKIGAKPTIKGVRPDRATRAAWTPDRDREKIRGFIARWLFYLIAVLSIGSAAALIFGQVTGPDFKDILTGLFAPLLGVFGTIIGFYYGSQAKSAVKGDDDHP